MPSRGILVFDFVSGSTPPEDAEPIGDDQLADFLHHGIGIQFDEAGQPVPEANFDDADLQVSGWVHSGYELSGLGWDDDMCQIAVYRTPH